MDACAYSGVPFHSPETITKLLVAMLQYKTKSLNNKFFKMLSDQNMGLINYPPSSHCLIMTSNKNHHTRDRKSEVHIYSFS